jgi:hypothetical protein
MHKKVALLSVRNILDKACIENKVLFQNYVTSPFLQVATEQPNGQYLIHHKTTDTNFSAQA